MPAKHKKGDYFTPSRLTNSLSFKTARVPCVSTPITVKMTTDFREAVAAATEQKLERLGLRSLAGLGESGCAAVPGGKRLQYWIDIPHLILAVLCMLSGFTCILLSFLHIMPRQTFFIVMLSALAVTLCVRKVKAWIVRICLANRVGNMIRGAKGHPIRPVGIEEAQTLHKAKMIIEDRGICLFDFEQHRLLIEGCAYRYVVYARDVFSVEARFAYASSGALLECRMAGQVLKMALKSDSFRPVASLIQTFSPATSANALASLLNEALFGVKATAHRQRELPPPLPTS